MIGSRIIIEGWARRHPFKVVKGDISPYTLVGYDEDGCKDDHHPVDIAVNQDQTLTVNFVMVDGALGKRGKNGRWYPVKEVKTKVAFTKSGRVVA